MKYSIRQIVFNHNPKPMMMEAPTLKRAIKNLYGDDGEIRNITVKAHPCEGKTVIVDCLDGNRDHFIVEEVK